MSFIGFFRFYRRNYLARGVVRESSKLSGEFISLNRLDQIVKQHSNNSSSLIMEGETGTGKNLIANLIAKNYRNGRSVLINFAEIPDALIESELFGVKAGAYTSVNSDRPGLIRSAHEGVLILDEISELSLSAQAKLLRFLEEREIKSLGDSQVFKVDLKIIVLTSVNIKKLVKEGKFRADLLFRLGELKLETTPLRKQLQYLPAIIEEISTDLKTKGFPELKFSTASIKALQSYGWPGNYRELKSLIASLAVTTNSNFIGLKDLPEYIIRANSIEQSIEVEILNDDLCLTDLVANFEADLISKTLELYDGNISAAAGHLRIKRTTLHEKMKRHKLA